MNRLIASLLFAAIALVPCLANEPEVMVLSQNPEKNWALSIGGFIGDSGMSLGLGVFFSGDMNLTPDSSLSLNILAQPIGTFSAVKIIGNTDTFGMDFKTTGFRYHGDAMFHWAFSSDRQEVPLGQTLATVGRTQYITMVPTDMITQGRLRGGLGFEYNSVTEMGLIANGVTTIDIGPRAYIGVEYYFSQDVTFKLTGADINPMFAGERRNNSDGTLFADIILAIPAADNAGFIGAKVGAKTMSGPMSIFFDFEYDPIRKFGFAFGLGFAHIERPAPKPAE